MLTKAESTKLHRAVTRYVRAVGERNYADGYGLIESKEDRHKFAVARRAYFSALASLTQKEPRDA